MSSPVAPHITRCPSLNMGSADIDSVTNHAYISNIILAGMPRQTGRGFTAPAFVV